MSMAERDGWIWYDGKLVPWREATTHVLTHTLHYGMGVFEGVRCYKTDAGPAIFRLADHTDRLFRSAQIFGMKIPFSKEEVNEAQKECVREQQARVLLHPPDRVLRQPRDGRGGEDPTRCCVAIGAWPWGAYLGAEGLEKGIRVRTSSYTHHHPNVTMCKAKAVGNYSVSILANQEATHDGYDEAMLLDPQGFVCQGSGENVFIVRDGELHTPDLSGGALEGITRATIIDVRARARHPGRSSGASRATRSTSPTRRSSPAPPPRSRPSASTTTARSATASAGRSPQRLQALFFDTVNGRNRPEEALAHPGVTMSEPQATAAGRSSGPSDLPVFCPNPAMPLWSSHPRVFLDIDEAGEARCPYCSTLYRAARRSARGRPLTPLAAAPARSRPGPSPLPRMTGERILIVAPSWVGDAILSEPLVALLREPFEDPIVDVLAPPWCAAVYSRMRGVRRIIESPLAHGKLDLAGRAARSRAELRGNGYTRAIVLPNSWKSALVPFLAASRSRTGYRGEMRYGAPERRAPARPQGDAAAGRPLRRARRPARRAGADAARAGAGSRPRQPQRRDAGAAPAHRQARGRPLPRRRVRPGEALAAHALRRARGTLPGRRAAGLDRRLAQRQARRRRRAAVGRRAGTGHPRPQRDARTSAPRSTSCRSRIVVVSNDSGLMHAAAAVGVPVVALFGSSSPVYTPPLSPVAQVARIDIACSPCFKRECPLGPLQVHARARARDRLQSRALGVLLAQG